MHYAIRPRMLRILPFLLLWSVTASAAVRVSAAASLMDALEEIAAGYEQRTGETIVFNFGASSTLARQIEQGAPADLFLSADERSVAALSRARLVQEQVRFLSNTLAIVTTSGQPMSPHDLRNVRTLALGDPVHVPAGVYAREHLTRLGIWAAVASKVIPAANVRAALSAVESGNADAAIVYRTDARRSKDVRIAYEVKRHEGPAITYPFVLLKNGNSVASRRFYAHLHSNEARAVFRRHGFVVP